MISKLLIGLSLFVYSEPTFAQDSKNEKLYVFNIGYGYTSGAYTIPQNETLKMTFSHLPMTYEFYSRNAYFYTDILTPCVDLCLGAFNKEFWWGHKEGNYLFRGGDWPLLRLAFGGQIGSKFALYGGGQWGYSQWRINGSNENFILYDEVTEEQLGGHLYGVGVHPTFKTSKLLLRGSFMYDFVTDGFKGKNYTNAFTYDLMARYLFSHKIGVFMNYINSNRKDVTISKLRIGLSLNFTS
jgi:hypothetical protein